LANQLEPVYCER